ncbi:MAG TPA: hypothetical protein VE978_08765 [Chitinophagales bacterium]|nr:hypothetical protein [Chitinophagales bacterium]
MKKLVAVLFSFCAIASFHSCQGPEGPPGLNGVANIITYNITTNSSSWSWDGTNDLYYTDVQIPDITQSVIDAGTVQAFYSNSDFSYFIALPSTESLLWIGYSYFLGIGEIDYGLTDGTQPANPGTKYFKMVVIPPAARQANPDVNWEDYNDIAKHFKITEVPVN